ncbi:hypothetical protein [Acinetobacter bereziniae]|uniref:hypothetical protein n=1 Tax=Acinetobacter bereziniae TaxID=106648 RepID=UPI001D18C137|nr:hypothetical protein [Acinetobacter bereziniae]
MKSNLSQHPCKGKCTEFKNEQCKTCLVREIEKREFKLDVAPDQAYVKTTFKMDDLIVKISGDDDALYVFAIYSTVNPDYCYIGEPYAEDGEMIHIDEIRLASTAEIQANRRLTEAEQALAEVS